jgi:hypothetical protein
MPDTLTARLSEPISRPELSKMWESERSSSPTGVGDAIAMRVTAPELDFVTEGDRVHLSFPSGSRDPEHSKLKVAFERAVHRYRPEVRVEWPPKTRKAG